jgi:outer membrane protein OmpA-like peptidoglycan-associated protein
MHLRSAEIHLHGRTFPLTDGDVTLDDYPEYGDELRSLSGAHQAALRALANNVSNSLGSPRPARIIYIVGHADVALREAAGQRRTNLELEVSQRRAKAVRKILESQISQLSPGCLRLLATIDAGAGSQALKVRGARTEAEMRKNRRVEIHVAYQHVHGPTCTGTLVGG